jgi:plastocyanin
MRRLFVPVALILTGVIVGVTLAAPAIEAGGGGHGGCRPREGVNEPVVIKDNCFGPTVLYVETGVTVEWQQQDMAPHNVTLLDGEVVGGDGELYDGDSVSRVFDSPGVFAYYCSIHPMMLGVVVAGDPASAAFSANLSLQTDTETTAGGTGQDADAFKGSGSGGGFRWGEAAIGAGLFGGLVVGLVAVGGGRLRRR